MRLFKLLCITFIVVPLTAQVKTFVTYTPVSWSSITTYAVNDMVTVGTGGSLVTYVSLIPNNLNNIPGNSLGTDWNIIGTAGSGGGGGTVTTTGSPTSGNMAKFSGSTSVTNAVPGTDYILGVNGTSITQNSGVASINLSNANTWTAMQTFSAGITATHIVGSGASPTIAGGTGYTPSLDSNAHDSSGIITVVASSGSNGVVATITFGSAFSTIPHCVISAGNTNAAGVTGLIFNAQSTTSATITNTAGLPNNTYSWNYVCQQ